MKNCHLFKSEVLNFAVKWNMNNLWRPKSPCSSSTNKQFKLNYFSRSWLHFQLEFGANMLLQQIMAIKAYNMPYWMGRVEIKVLYWFILIFETSTPSQRKSKNVCLFGLFFRNSKPLSVLLFFCAENSTIISQGATLSYLHLGRSM